LDRLSVGGGASGTALQAGRYVARGVYIGAKQAVGASKTTNGEADPTTQATVQIDLTKRLKIEGDVGAGQGANAVGLTYQFEY
jgi:translocation and assembly module TamB